MNVVATYLRTLARASIDGWNRFWFTPSDAATLAVIRIAAGAMLYVVVEELIPETARSGSVDVATLGFIGGFTVMMVLDNALG